MFSFFWSWPKKTHFASPVKMMWINAFLLISIFPAFDSISLSIVDISQEKIFYYKSLKKEIDPDFFPIWESGTVTCKLNTKIHINVVAWNIYLWPFTSDFKAFPTHPGKTIWQWACTKLERGVSYRILGHYPMSTSVYMSYPLFIYPFNFYYWLFHFPKIFWWS